MADTVKVEILRDTQVGEQSVFTGETHTIDAADAKLLVRMKKAVYVGKPPADQAETATDEARENAAERKTRRRAAPKAAAGDAGDGDDDKGGD